MQIEHEIIFYPVDTTEFISRITSLGAILVHDRFLMKRAIFDTQRTLDQGQWIRIRQEFARTTWAVKGVQNLTELGKSETQIDVSDFDGAVTLAELMGAKQRSYQENYRTTWELQGAEIVIDEWPGLDPLVEIEASDNESLRIIVEKLQLEYSKGRFGTVSGIYLEVLGTDIEKMPILTFESLEK